MAGLLQCKTALESQETVISWIEPFVESRTTNAAVGNKQSTNSDVTCDVPHGSVLGPVLFLLITADVVKIMQRHEVNSHHNVDDTLLYIDTNSTVYVKLIQRIVSGMDDINQWMTSNRLILNADKIQFICLSQQLGSE